MHFNKNLILSKYNICDTGKKKEPNNQFIKRVIVDQEIKKLI